jgi:hypothetical protein
MLDPADTVAIYELVVRKTPAGWRFASRPYVPRRRADAEAPIS